MTGTGLVHSTAIVLLGLIHMAAESRTFQHASRSGGAPDPLAGPVHDKLWLASCLLFVTHIGVCVFAALWLAPTVTGGFLAILAGIPAVCAGIVLRCRTIERLGTAFARPEIGANALVTDGVFGVVRHPSETGLALITIGLLLLAPQFWPLLTCMCVLASAAIRIRREDRGLSEKFGSGHAFYREQIPAVWPGYGGWRQLLGRDLQSG